jgi:ribosome-associated protein
MDEFRLAGHDYIELCDLLKVLGWCGSGGEAKIRIASGEALVEGEIELRKRCKVRSGQTVEFDGNTIKVV